MEKTLGEQRVRTSFNVTGSDTIAELKNATAKLIDMCEDLRPKVRYVDTAFGEQTRLIELAQKAYEEAAMWAVKAATI